MSAPRDYQACAAQSRRIAELDANWPEPGMACSTVVALGDADAIDFRWRRVASDWQAEWDDCEAAQAIDHDDQWHEADALRKAVADGPDFTDLATIGALLMSLPCPEVQEHGGSWYVQPDRYATTYFAPTLRLAILLAKVGYLEKNHGRQ